MIRTIRAIVQDSVMWGLLLLLVVVIAVGLATVFDRYEEYDQYRQRLIRMEYDIFLLQEELKDKKEWAQRLENDPTAWEQVAREKMNYLGPDELLVTFVSPKAETP